MQKSREQGRSSTGSRRPRRNRKSVDKSRKAEQPKAEPEKAEKEPRVEIGRRSHEAGRKLLDVADDLQAVSKGLRVQGKTEHADHAEQTAERLRRLGTYLGQGDLETLGDAGEPGDEDPFAQFASELDREEPEDPPDRKTASDGQSRRRRFEPSGEGSSRNADGEVSEGIRILVTQIAATGRDPDDIAEELREKFGVEDSRAIVAQLGY
jgi:hypothetical protein